MALVVFLDDPNSKRSEEESNSTNGGEPEKEYALGFPTSVLDMEMKNRMNKDSLIEFDGWLVLTEGLITAAVGG